MTTQVVTAATVRSYMGYTTTTGQYSDAIINQNVLAAQSFIEQSCNRYFADITFTSGTPWVTTSMLRAVVPIPGFRSFTAVTFGGTTLVQNQGFWAIPDVKQSGTFTAIQFRAFRADSSGPWWLADPLWFDKALDSPFYPGNYGGGYTYTSMPNDLTVAGSAGWAPGSEDPAFLDAVTILAGFKTARPASILADSAITATGGIITYSQLPGEVRDFISSWRAGTTVVSVGG